jgi:hypothetical protein
MDYSASFVAAVDAAGTAAGPWQQTAVGAARSGIGERVAAGPIGPRDATAIAGTLPSFYIQNFPALSPGQNPPSAPVNLAPILSTGFKSWYWHLGSVVGTGVVVLLTATLVAPNVPAWTLAVGYVATTTDEWVALPAQYFDASQVQVVPSGVQFQNGAASGSIIAAATGFRIAVTMPEFSYSLACSSARGPTYEQSTGPIETLGGIGQTGYWSIVDGDVMDGALNGVSGIASGRGWLDYQQEGLLPLSAADKFLVGLTTPPPGLGTPWLWAAMQLPDVQMALRVITAEGVAALARGAATDGLVNVWRVGQSPRYSVPATVQVIAWTGGAPSEVHVGVDGVLYVLKSISKTAAPLPGIAAVGSYEAPATVTSGGVTGVGSIEWVTQPSRGAVAQSAGMSPAYVAGTSVPDSGAVSTITVAAIVFVFLVVFLPTYLTTKQK